MTERTRICYTIGSFQSGGAEALLLTILRNLDRNKFQPFIFVANKDGALLNEYYNLDIPIYEFRYNNLIHFFRQVIKFHKFIKKNKIKIIHINLVGMYAISTLSTLFSKNIKRIVHWHNVYALNRTKKKFQVFFGSLFAHKIIAISKSVKSKNCNIYRINKNKVTVIYNSIDLKDFSSIATQTQNDKTLTCGCVGRLNKQKGYDTVIKAIQIISNRNSEFVFEIIGSGPLKDELKEMSFLLGCSERIKFLGDMSHEEVINRMKTWHLFVLGSRWEGFGIVLAEAMASGLAIVSTNVDAIPEVVKDGITGLLCSAENPKELANNMLILLQYRDRANKMGTAGRKRVEELFSIEKMMVDLENIYIKN